jgi:hypothetical protein
MSFVNWDPQDIGTRWDAPATADQLTTGPNPDGSPPPTLFALFKGILLQLMILNDSNQNVTN